MSDLTSEILHATAQHLLIVGVAMLVATSTGIPIGIACVRNQRSGRVVLRLIDMIQTIPSLALFGFLIPLPLIGGIGIRTAIVALILYSLLPVVRNTVTGIAGVDPLIVEAATALGMTERQRLMRIDLPLALPSIFGGIRIATVIAIGVATIAAAVGGGGLGDADLPRRGHGRQHPHPGRGPAGGGTRRRCRSALRRAGAAGCKTTWRVNCQNVCMRRLLATLAILLLAACSKQKPGLVGSKNFTESVLLGEIVAQRLERAGCTVERKLDLGGTLVCDKAITAGALDVYPEIRTALTAILHHDAMRDRVAVMKKVAADYEARGLSWGPALGFENTFAMIVRTADAQRLSLKTISDLAKVSATFRPGFGYEFVERPDGWNGLLQQYGLHFAEAPRTMDLGLTYRALAAGEIDLIAGNSTDGLIDALHLTVLADDRHFFPPYDAALVVRHDFEKKCPARAGGAGIAGRASRRSHDAPPEPGHRPR